MKPLVPALAVAALALASVPIASGSPPPRPPGGLRDGDIVFHESRSAQSEAIRLATGSRYTHVGMVFHRRGRALVLEASARVRMTAYARWVARGDGGHVVVKRLANAASVLDAAALSRMDRIGRHFLGRPYDARFEWSDDRLYCSELVYKIYERGAGVRLGELRPAGSFDLGSPAVRELLARRFRGPFRFDPDEPVVSPAAMFADSALVSVRVD